MRADAIEQMKLSLIGTLQNLKYGQHHYVESNPNTSSWKSGFESHHGLQSGSRGHLTKGEFSMRAVQLLSFLLPPSTHPDGRVVHVDRTLGIKKEKETQTTHVMLRTQCPLALAIV